MTPRQVPMPPDATTSRQQERSLYRLALWLAVISVVYNLAEGIVATWFGAQEETLALFGFGVDSFIEIVSALGIAHMVWRIQRNPHSERTRFETLALQITGVCFYLLSAGLILGAAASVLYGEPPRPSLAGTIIALISLAVMWALLKAKMYAGTMLQSPPIIADARCTLACMWMSAVLLGSSFAFYLTGIRFIDAIGAVGIAWFSFLEGREALAIARGQECCHHN
jgi:divalent metal cation (Fe/Co/Zn/Cd) transporter